MCSCHAARNKKGNVLCLLAQCHSHPPWTMRSSSSSALTSATLRKKMIGSEVKVSLVLKGTECQTHTSKHDGDLQGRKGFKRFSLCIYRQWTQYLFLDLLHWLEPLLQYLTEARSLNILVLFLTFKAKHLDFSPLRMLWTEWFL